MHHPTFFCHPWLFRRFSRCEMRAASRLRDARRVFDHRQRTAIVAHGACTEPHSPHALPARARGCTLALATRVIKKCGHNNQKTREDNVRAYLISNVVAPLTLLALSTHAGAQPASPTSPTPEVLRVTRTADDGEG
jgi:hypothetical protein